MEYSLGIVLASYAAYLYLPMAPYINYRGIVQKRREGTVYAFYGNKERALHSTIRQTDGDLLAASKLLCVCHY